MLINNKGSFICMTLYGFIIGLGQQKKNKGTKDGEHNINNQKIVEDISKAITVPFSSKTENEEKMD